MNEPVRCQACGGIFEGDARVCTYCNAGVRFAGLGLPSIPTELPCPRCQGDRKLFEVGYRGVRIDVCPYCEGSWYDLGELEEMVKNARQDSKTGRFESSGKTLPRSAEEGGAHDDLMSPVYVRCPHCDKLMGRKNWESRSGVMVDFCHVHGFWLDGGEIQRVRAWSAQNPDGPPPPIEAHLPEPMKERHSRFGGGVGSHLDSLDYGSHTMVGRGSLLIWLLGRLLGR